MTDKNNNNVNFSEQLTLVYAALPLSLTGSLLAASVYVAVMWQVIPPSHLLTWQAAFSLIILYRFIIYFYFQRSLDKLSPHWVSLFNVGVILAACAWGAVSLWLFPANSLSHQVFIAFMITGVVAAAAVSLSPLWNSFLLFMVPTLLPFVHKLLLSPSEINVAITIGTAIFTTFMIINARKSFLNIRQNIALHQQNTDNEKAILASRHELEQSRHMLSWVLDTIPVSVYWKDTQGRYLGCNQVFANESGLAAQAIIGKTDAQLTAARYKPDLQDAEVSVITSGVPSLHQELFLLQAEGKIRWFDYSLVPLTDLNGQVIGVLGTSHDITGHKRIEEIKNEFISTVSHELRTPLTSIRGAIGLLRGIHTRQNDKQVEELMTIAHNNTERLLLLIDDLLNIQKIESGYMDFQFEPVRLMQLIQQILKDNLSLAKQYGVSFTLEKVEKELIVRADPQRLTQVITNLLSNAAKFSHVGQKIEIGICRDRHNSLIYVQDYGVGIPAAFHDKLFDRFTQWDASNTRKVGGTGLGLNIVKSIVERHGGSISFESQEGVGTRFEITLPLSEVQPHSEPIL